METKDSMPFPHESANYDEVSMQQSMIFSDSLKDLKNLRRQLYSAAEYFESSYGNDEQKDIVVNTLKDYAIKALVNAVDHLGSVTYKVNDMLDEKVHEVSGTELRVSCIQQRLRTCQEYVDREGLSQQSLVINTPRYHKRYVLPIMHGTVRTKSRNRGCSLDDRDGLHPFNNSNSMGARAMAHETSPPSTVGKGPSPPASSKFTRNFSFSNNMPTKDLEKRATSPHPFPLMRSGSLSTAKSSNTTTSNESRSTTPNPSLGRQAHNPEPRKSASVRAHVGKESEKNPSKSKRLLKSLLGRRKSKNDDMLYTYLDEY